MGARTRGSEDRHRERKKTSLVTAACLRFAKIAFGCFYALVVTPALIVAYPLWAVFAFVLAVVLTPVLYIFVYLIYLI